MLADWDSRSPLVVGVRADVLSTDFTGRGPRLDQGTLCIDRQSFKEERYINQGRFNSGIYAWSAHQADYR